MLRAYRFLFDDYYRIVLRIEYRLQLLRLQLGFCLLEEAPQLSELQDVVEEETYGDFDWQLVELLVVILMVDAECQVYEANSQHGWEQATRGKVSVRRAHEDTCEETVVQSIVDAVRGHDDSLCFVSDLGPVPPRLVSCAGLVNVEEGLENDHEEAPISKWPDR